ncbi:MAG: hypothetical protein LAT51_12160 [Flavobacteriaceae bacterium]|nr:hypothetical protein [Flavobacteriaceae bacterium]
MKFYLKDLLPRLKKYSAELDHASFLVDKPWVVSGEEHGPFQKLIFRRDGRVHLSNDGNLTDGKWEYLPEAKALIIDYGETKKLFRHEFLDEAVLALKVDGRKTDNDDDYLLLSDENRVPDADAKFYLKNKYLKENNLKAEKLTDGNEIYLEVANPHINFSDYKISDKNGLLPDGIYYVNDGNSRYKVKGGIARKAQKLHKYPNGISIWQSYAVPQKGEEVTGLSEGSFDHRFDDDDYRIEVDNGKVAKTTNKTDSNRLIISIMILFLIVIGVIIMGF